MIQTREDVGDIDDAAYIAAGLDARLNEEEIPQERMRLLIFLVYKSVLNSPPKEDWVGPDGTINAIMKKKWSITRCHQLQEHPSKKP